MPTHEYVTYTITNFFEQARAAADLMRVQDEEMSHLIADLEADGWTLVSTTREATYYD